MKNVPTVVIFVTLYAMFFQVAIFIALPENIIFGLFALSPFLILYMVYIVLKHGKPSRHTFDEKFYEDHDYLRNGKE